MGDTVYDKYSFGHSEIPLTDGEWVIIGRQYNDGIQQHVRVSDQRAFQTTNPYVRTVLARFDESNNILIESLLITANVLINGSGWVGSICEYDRILEKKIYINDKGGKQKCWYIGHTMTSLNREPTEE